MKDEQLNQQNNQINTEDNNNSISTTDIQNQSSSQAPFKGKSNEKVEEEVLDWSSVDPNARGVLEDLMEQEQEGKDPSMDVAVARFYGIDGLQRLLELADNENYEGAQNAVSDGLASQKEQQAQDALMGENFDKSMENIEKYGKDMNYSEEETHALAKHIFEIMKVVGDGIITADEVAVFDKGKNYDKDISDLTSQISASPKSSKEVLPDQPSMDAAPTTIKREDKPARHNGPGLGSLSAYDNPVTDITAVKGQKRRGRGN